MILDAESSLPIPSSKANAARADSKMLSALFACLREFAGLYGVILVMYVIPKIGDKNERTTISNDSIC